MNPAGRPLSSMAWSRALRAADSASRISPLSFDGDKRGRMRQFYEAVAFAQKFLWSDVSLRCWQILVRFRILVRTHHLVPRLHRRLRLLQTAACLEKLRWYLSMIGSLLLWSVLGTIQIARLRVFLLRLGILMRTWPNGGPFADVCFGVVWERKFLQCHLLLISLVEHSPSLRILIGTDSSVTADLPMVQNDSLGSVICLGLHDSVRIHVRDVSDSYYA